MTSSRRRHYHHLSLDTASDLTARDSTFAVGELQRFAAAGERRPVGTRTEWALGQRTVERVWPAAQVCRGRSSSSRRRTTRRKLNTDQPQRPTPSIAWRQASRDTELYNSCWCCCCCWWWRWWWWWCVRSHDTIVVSSSSRFAAEASTLRLIYDWCDRHFFPKISVMNWQIFDDETKTTTQLWVTKMRTTTTTITQHIGLRPEIRQLENNSRY